ncbi:MAG: 1-(5-phosphoribosyl)-5-[(5-phosphoribosylamino)methylideneamino]imidazole-4-carboxamide isomerase [bacterium]
MKIYPAIDLKDGMCVRLRQGRMDSVTVYSEDPVAMARQWADAGGDWLHVVDLDGAFAGHPVHYEVVKAMAAAISIPVELGGGLRTDADIRRMLDAGVRRVILGTRACADPEALAALVKTFGDQIAVGIDARNGKVQVKGWVDTTDTLAVDLAIKASAAGISTIIYTDTATDGMLTGPNLDGVRTLCRRVKSNVIASGGISQCGDIAALASLQLANLEGVIVGKALYEGAVTIPSMKAALKPAASS